MAMARHPLRPHVGRTEDLAPLLPYMLERCSHEPPAHEDGPALCDTCSNVLVVLVDRIEEPDDIMH